MSVSNTVIETASQAACSEHVTAARERPSLAFSKFLGREWLLPSSVYLDEVFMIESFGIGLRRDQARDSSDLGMDVTSLSALP